MYISEVNKSFGIQNNVIFRVVDVESRQIVQQVEGHNSSTLSLLSGIGQFLSGSTSSLLSDFIPQYMSLGTMGLMGQASDDSGLPIGLGRLDDEGYPVDESGTRLDPDSVEYKQVVQNYIDYIRQAPGFGADGTDANNNNDRPFFGLGLNFDNSEILTDKSEGFELILHDSLRTPILHREFVEDPESELPNTVDVIYSSLISVGQLAEFRQDNNYIFISEAGLWSRSTYKGEGMNGLLAGYRIAPVDSDSMKMGPSGDDDDTEDTPEYAQNRKNLQKMILRVGVNQVVQIIWKLQIGSIEDLSSQKSEYDEISWYWNYPPEKDRSYWFGWPDDNSLEV